MKISEHCKGCDFMFFCLIDTTVFWKHWVVRCSECHNFYFDPFVECDPASLDSEPQPRAPLKIKCDLGTEELPFTSTKLTGCKSHGGKGENG